MSIPVIMLSMQCFIIMSIIWVVLYIDNNVYVYDYTLILTVYNVLRLEEQRDDLIKENFATLSRRRQVLWSPP